MEDSLKILWDKYGDKVEESRILNMQSWALNVQCMEMIQSQKAKSKLWGLFVSKIGGLIIGFVWVYFLGVLLYYSKFQNPFFSISVGIIFLFNVVAIINYIRHLIMMGQISFSESITDTQEKLAKLQTAIVSNNRFLLLQFPFHSTWFYNWQWIHNDPLSFWLIAVPISIALAILGIFLYVNYSKKNLHKPWVKALMNSSGFRSVTKALNFIQEIDAYKKDKV